MTTLERKHIEDIQTKTTINEIKEYLQSNALSLISSHQHFFSPETISNLHSFQMIICTA